MDDLIYKFLLQSGFPRASIVFDVDLLGPSVQVGSGLKVPTFVIVDPDTADPLAVIRVVGALRNDVLKQCAIETGAYASRLAGKMLQGFVIRVDAQGQTEEEQVQFFRIWPNSTLQQLSSKKFPDLGSLRVSRKLGVNTMNRSSQSISSVSGLSLEGKNENKRARLSFGMSADAGLYVPGVILLFLMIFDGLLGAVKGQPFLTVPQSILAFGAALLLSLPAAIRYLRQQ